MRVAIIGGAIALVCIGLLIGQPSEQQSQVLSVSDLARICEHPPLPPAKIAGERVTVAGTVVAVDRAIVLADDEGGSGATVSVSMRDGRRAEIGERVTVTGTVETSIGRTIFLVDCERK